MNLKQQITNEVWDRFTNLNNLGKTPKEIYQEIIEEKRSDHDCHTSPNDGCFVCDELFELLNK